MGVAHAVALPGERRLVIDNGGGSTELILGRGPEIERVESFSVGTVKQSLSFFIGGRVDGPSFEAAILSARSHFEDAAPPYHPQFWKQCYGSSGTARTIADIIVKNGLGREVNAQSLEALKQRFIAFGHVGRIDMPGLKADRASTIIGGLAILIGLVRELDIPVVVPIEAGLRMGVMWDLHLRSTKRDRREQSVQACVQRFHVDERRANRVAVDSLALYAQTKPASDQYGRLLYWSALLHEMGMVVSHTGYHKHAAYIIENADLPGFTAREQRTMSCLIVSHKGNLRKVGEALTEIDFAKAIVAFRLAVLFMHSRIDLDFTQIKLRFKSRIELEIRREWVAEHPTLSYWLEKEQEQWDEVGVDFLIRTTG
jgi:exopolyphosphatase/guanosine-5'-triphosphate,3'-diphosphate pyrophosphatase